MAASFPLPDALVLGGGGILGEAWMSSLLAGLEAEAGLDARSCGHFVGTSAGSIVAAGLAAGRSPEGIADDPGLTEPADAAEAPRGSRSRAPLGLLGRGLSLSAVATAPLAPLALAAAAPGGRLARRALLARAPRPSRRRQLAVLGRAIEQAGPTFDGRLRVVAVERASGRRVVFGGAKAPPASVADAVMASCSVPWLFAPITIGGREYVDGGVWSPTSMDVAPVGRGARVLCLNPTGFVPSGANAAFGSIGVLSRSIAAVEALALRRRGAQVQVVAPDRAAQRAIGLNLMDPGPRSRVVQAGYAQGRALARG